MIAKDPIPESQLPDLRPTIKELLVPGSDDRIVLVNPDLGPTERPFANLVRRDVRDALLWTADLPAPIGSAPYDCYVDITWDDGVLAANTWSGQYTTIDPATGKVLCTEFTK
jgi:hypothetical protein